MKKNVLTFLLFGIFIFKSYSQVSQSPACVDFDIARYPVTIQGIYQNGVGPQDVAFSWNTIWNFPNPLKQTRVTSLNIANGMFKGLLQYLPASYSLPANSTKKYPVIIYFHGGGSIGNGTFADLCRLFKDTKTDLNTYLSIPGRVERNTSLFSQTYLGETQEYIVISPQFSKYIRLDPNGAPDDFPTAPHVEAVIDYVVQHYRIDPRRIYLTGFSNGANMITEYAASSLARAKRVAAIMPVALCSILTHPNNVNLGYKADYIGEAKLKTWFIYCETDNCGVPGQFTNAPVAWVNKIKTIPGNEPPRFTVLKNLNPPTLYNCSDTLTHDAWSRAYNPDFKASFVNGTGANDGINLNAYEWFARAQSAVLPVILQSYSARLINDRVEINWTTSDEKDNKSFTIERAGKDQKFKPIGTVPGAINNTGNKGYSFIDNEPLSDLSYYRLVQNDIDGEKTYFEIKKIINRNGNQNAISVTPNPFGSELSAYISLSRSQKVSITVTDMAGKIVKSTNGIYGQGSSEIKLSSHDLSSGIYLFKISGEDFSTTQKVVKR